MTFLKIVVLFWRQMNSIVTMTVCTLDDRRLDDRQDEASIDRGEAAVAVAVVWSAASLQTFTATGDRCWSKIDRCSVSAGGVCRSGVATDERRLGVSAGLQWSMDNCDDGDFNHRKLRPSACPRHAVQQSHWYSGVAKGHSVHRRDTAVDCIEAWGK